MGFLSSLKAGFDSVKSGLDGEMAKFKNADAVNASLAIVALVAGADGDIEKEERAAGADFVRKGKLFEKFDRAKLASTLEDYYGKATNPILKEDLFDVIRKIKADAVQARAVVKVGLAIANSDGDFEDEEKEVLVEVCDTLGLNASDFKGLS